MKTLLLVARVANISGVIRRYRKGLELYDRLYNQGSIGDGLEAEFSADIARALTELDKLLPKWKAEAETEMQRKLESILTTYSNGSYRPFIGLNI